MVGAAFLVQVLTTGLQFAFGVLAAQIARHFRKETSNVAVHMEAGQLSTLNDIPALIIFSYYCSSSSRFCSIIVRYV